MRKFRGLSLCLLTCSSTLKIAVQQLPHSRRSTKALPWILSYIRLVHTSSWHTYGHMGCNLGAESRGGVLAQLLCGGAPSSRLPSSTACPATPHTTASRTLF